MCPQLQMKSLAVRFVFWLYLSRNPFLPHTLKEFKMLTIMVMHGGFKLLGCDKPKCVPLKENVLLMKLC